MVDYSLIKNEKLRTMVMESESIHTLAEAEIQAMVGKIAKLNPEGEQAFLEALENEKQEVERAKAGEQIDPEEATVMMQKVQENDQKLTNVIRSFDTFVRGTREESVREVENQQAEELLKLLDQL